MGARQLFEQGKAFLGSQDEYRCSQGIGIHGGGGHDGNALTFPGRPCRWKGSGYGGTFRPLSGRTFRNPRRWRPQPGAASAWRSTLKGWRGCRIPMVQGTLSSFDPLHPEVPAALTRKCSSPFPRRTEEARSIAYPFAWLPGQLHPPFQEKDGRLSPVNSDLPIIDPLQILPKDLPRGNFPLPEIHSRKTGPIVMSKAPPERLEK